jgi:hypothetical protein
MIQSRFILPLLVVLACGSSVLAQDLELMPIGKAWASNSINAIVFRGDPITTHENLQYAAYYDANGNVVIASREIDQRRWKTTVTLLKGNLKDAHNSISLIADGEGYLHVAWDHHGHALRYVRSKASGSLEFTDRLPMTGRNEGNVTYPQFFRLPDGNLLFLFRDGQSGRGNLVVNRYDTQSQTWTQLHDNLISGEDRRNAYWQAAVDAKGAVHLSWIWRETPDVATNHDLCYARSDDGGRTWLRSNRKPYALPITAATAEIAAGVPQKHELINQTSMCADEAGRPIIATYFRPPDDPVVQYFLVYHDGSAWKTVQVSQRTTPFSLSGLGTKQVPIARPQVLAATRGGKTHVWMVFRDTERGSRVSVAHCSDLARPTWDVRDLTDFSVRSWEPAFDRARWQRDDVLALYVQVTGQGDGEGLESLPPQVAYVLEWKP